MVSSRWESEHVMFAAELSAQSLHCATFPAAFVKPPGGPLFLKRA